MSVTDPLVPESSTAVTKTTSVVNGTLTLALGLIVPVVTIAGLIVLLALHDIDQTAAIALIGGLAGLHGGAAVANASK